MATVPPRAGRRTWKILIGVMVVVFLILLALAMLSEREDARVLPPDELEPVEEPYAPPPNPGG